MASSRTGTDQRHEGRYPPAFIPPPPGLCLRLCSDRQPCLERRHLLLPWPLLTNHLRGIGLRGGPNAPAGCDHPRTSKGGWLNESAPAPHPEEDKAS